MLRQGQEKYTYVQRMFGRIAKHYNLMNTLMTGGQDRHWRRFVVRQARLTPTSRVLDIASGTGDIAFEAVRQVPQATVVAADFALPMMHVGQRQPLGGHVMWCGADAMNLPFGDQTFDVVLAGYLLRNVPDIPRTLQEMRRVLKPGGRLVLLDSTPPPPSLLRPLMQLYMGVVIPFVGKLLTRDPEAYSYLPDSIQAFKTPQELALMLAEQGFEGVAFRTFVNGAMSVHWAQTPLEVMPSPQLAASSNGAQRRVTR